MKIKFTLTVMMLMSAALLSGCASLNSSFDCPMKPGVMCESLDEVNMQVDQGLLGSPTNTTPCKNCHKLVSNPTQLNDKASSANLSDANSNLNVPIRRSETTLRIWTAPYEDKDGNYYQPNVIYTVIKPGFWVDQPVKAISKEGDAV
jgi:type IV conjugative transfer system lipoprotein TraV